MESYWQYFLITNDWIQDYSKLRIKSSGKDIEFTEPVLTTLASDTQALLITSLNTIKIEESHDIHLSLVSIDSLGQNKILFKYLPRPNKDYMFIDENGKIYHSIYMYL